MALGAVSFAFDCDAVEEPVAGEDDAAVCPETITDKAHGKRLSSSRTRNLFIGPSEPDYSRFAIEKRERNKYNRRG